MSVKFLFVIFGGIVLALVDNARILPRVKRQSLKVRITAKDDSIVLQYLSSSPAIKLQGYVLGYGGRYSKQNISLPDNGDPIEVDVEFNPKYLIAVHPVTEQNNAALGKKCKGNLELHKPPQIMIDTRTPTSVFLSWAHSFTGKVYKSVGKECGDERHYTVRYREKEKSKKWLYQCCPTSETMIDNLKPNTVYEFGVRVTKAKENGIWSKPTSYATTVTSSPTSTENDPSQKISKKLAIKFNSGNIKNLKKLKLPGKTNIIGTKDRKDFTSSNPGRNGTNWRPHLIKKPDVNTQTVLERTPAQMHDKEDIITLKNKETSNTVTKPTLKKGKTNKATEKAAMKPLTTKASKLPSSVSPSSPSKPVPKLDAAEIQIPVFLTPSTTSELDTMDKQQSTEPETPASTILPFIILSTTSGHTAVDKQHLPGTTSALDPVETEQFSEPEIPSSSSAPFHSTSEPDAMDMQKFTEPEIRSFSISSVNPTPEPVAMDVQRFTEPEVPSTTSSFLSSSNMASKLDVMDKEQFTELEEPSSKDSFYFNSHTTSEPDTMDKQQLTEYGVLSSIRSKIITLLTTTEPDAMDKQEFTEDEVQSTVKSFFTTSNTIYEFDSTQRKQISEFEVPFSSSSPVNTLKTSKLDVMDTKTSKEFEIPSSNSPFIITSELNAVDNQQFTEPEVSSSTTSKLFITSNPIATVDVKGQQPFTDDKLPDYDTPNGFSLFSVSKLDNMGKKKTTDHELPDPNTPIPVSDIGNIEEKEFTDYELPVSDIPYVFRPIPVSELPNTGKKEFSDHKLPAPDTPDVVSPTPVSEINNTKEKDVADYELPVSDTPNVSSSIPESEPASIGDTDVTDPEVPTSDTPTVSSLNSDYELSVSDSPYVFSPIPESEPAKIGEPEVTDPEVPTSDTPAVSSLISDYELPVSDSPHVFSPIPESEPAKIGEPEVTDYELSTSDTAILFNPTPVYDTGKKKITDHKLPTSDTSHVFIPTSVSELDHIEDKEFTDYKLTNSDTSYVFSPTPISEHGNIEDKEFTAHKLPKFDTPRMFSSTPTELDNKEDEEFTENKLPTSGTPHVFIQSQESASDNIEDEDVADYYERPTSGTPYVFRPTPVSQLGSAEKKELTESDPPSDISPIITSNAVPKPDAKQEFTEPETPSTDDQFHATVSGSTQGSYVKYMTKPNMPCSITESLKNFPEENATNAKATAAPRYGPSNLTLVTVEGCPTFLIVDWEKNENDSASEYEVLSKMRGPDNNTEELLTVTNQTHTAVENLKPNTSYTFLVTPTNVHGRGPSSEPLPFVTESADPSVSEYVPGKDAIWTQYSFKFDSYSECQGRRFVKRTRYRKFVGIILCNSLRYKIYLSNSLSGVFYNIGDLSGQGEDHCQFVDSFLDGRTGEHLLPEQLPIRQGFYRSVRQEPVMFGTIGGQTHIKYVHWYECGIAIPGQW